MKWIDSLLLTFLVCILFTTSWSQGDFVTVTTKGVYEFLDEMANEQIIQLNTTIKPYSSDLIYEKLEEISINASKLNERQKAELNFYQDAFKLIGKSNTNPFTKRKYGVSRSTSFSTNLMPIGLHYKDSLFTFTLRPIWGIDNWVNNNGRITQTRGGAEVKGKVGEHVGFYASLRDNHINDILVYNSTLTNERGGAYQTGKVASGGADFNEMIGGITYRWKWGDLGFVKDIVVWGDNENGATIFSGRSPSFPMIKLHASPSRWLDFNYFHGWLVSEVIDSNRTYVSSNGDIRLQYRNKFIAANSFSIIPKKGINITLGNSIVYSDVDFQFAYLIPVLFYKSVDHTLNHLIDNHNSQMFANFNLRVLPHTSVYATYFVDEFAIKRVFTNTLHNFVSFKVGFKITNWPIQNLFISTEYYRSNPITYRHRIETLSFESNKYNLGHYLVDNARELYIGLNYRPLPKLRLIASYTNAIKGNIYPYTRRGDPTANPVLKDKIWYNSRFVVGASYEFLYNSYLHFNLQHTNIITYDVDNISSLTYSQLFTPTFFLNKQTTINFGGTIGF